MVIVRKPCRIVGLWENEWNSVDIIKTGISPKRLCTRNDTDNHSLPVVSFPDSAEASDSSEPTRDQKDELDSEKNEMNEIDDDISEKCVQSESSSESDEGDSVGGSSESNLVEGMSPRRNTDRVRNEDESEEVDLREGILLTNNLQRINDEKTSDDDEEDIVSRSSNNSNYADRFVPLTIIMANWIQIYFVLFSNPPVHWNIEINNNVAAKLLTFGNDLRFPTR